jgi:DNA primase
VTLSASQRDSLTAAATGYHDHLVTAQPEVAVTYLEERGLWDEGLVATFRLGLVADPAPGHETYAGRLVIPYLTPSGVVNLRFRDLTGHSGAKYLGLGESTNLYNVAALHGDSDTVLVCEGELDVVAATHAGYAAVGVPGAKAWKPHYGRLLADPARVVVVADGDEAGRDLAKVVAKWVEHAEVRLMPDGHDVNSFLLEEGVEAFDAWVAT